MQPGEMRVTNLKPTRAVREGDGVRNACRCGCNGLRYILFLPAPDLFLFSAGMQAGQEMITVLSPAAGSSDRKSPACQKSKIPGVHAGLFRSSQQVSTWSVACGCAASSMMPPFPKRRLGTERPAAPSAVGFPMPAPNRTCMSPRMALR